MKKYFITLLYTSLFISTISYGAFAGNDKVDLKLNLEKGKSYRFETKINQTISQEVMGTNQTMINNMIFEYSFKVNSFENNIYSVIATYERVYMYTYNDAMGATEFDTRKEGETVPEQYKQFSALIGLSYTVTLDPYGHVKEVRGAEEMVNQLVKKLAPAENEEESLRKNLEMSYNAETLKREVENTLSIFPEKEVGVGDTWNESKEVNASFPIKKDSKWTLLKYKKNKVNLEVTSTLVSDEEKTVEINDMEFKYNLKGTQKGSYDVDATTGLIIASKVSQEVSGDMEVVSGMLAGQSIPMSFKTEVESRFF